MKDPDVRQDLQRRIENVIKAPQRHAARDIQDLLEKCLSRSRSFTDLAGAGTNFHYAVQEHHEEAARRFLRDLCGDANPTLTLRSSLIPDQRGCTADLEVDRIHYRESGETIALAMVRSGLRWLVSDLERRKGFAVKGLDFTGSLRRTLDRLTGLSMNGRADHTRRGKA